MFHFAFGWLGLLCYYRRWRYLFLFLFSFLSALNDSRLMLFRNNWNRMNVFVGKYKFRKTHNNLMYTNVRQFVTTYKTNTVAVVCACFCFFSLVFIFFFSSSLLSHSCTRIPFYLSKIPLSRSRSLCLYILKKIRFSFITWTLS